MPSNRSLLSCGAAAVVLCVASQAAAQTRNFNIPAQTAVRAIPEFAQQAQIQVVAPARDLKGVRTPAVSGDLEVQVALSRLIAGTPLRVAANEGGVVTLRSVLGAGLVEAASFQEEAAAVTDIVVTGYRRQNELAVQQKRQADIEAEYLTTDETGQAPDFNIADALRRVPGVDTIFDEDEGRYVTIRGMDPDYTSGMMDGAMLGSSERNNRRLNMEAIPSTVVKTAEVRKSRTPDMEGNAVGGSINMITRSAFDTRGAFFVANAFAGVYDSTGVPGDDGLSYRTAATYATRLGDNDQFGVVAALTFLRRKRDQERSNPSSYALRDGAYVPTGFQTNAYPLSSDRYGGFLKLEYRPSDAFRAAVTASLFQQDEDELRLTNHFYLQGPITVADGIATAQRGRSYARYNDFPIEKPMKTFNGTFEWNLTDRSMLDMRASWSQAAFIETSNELRFITPTNRGELASTVDLTGNFPILTVVDPTYYHDASKYAFDYYKPYIDDSVDTVAEVEANYGWNIASGSRGWGFKVGGKLRRTDREMDRSESTWKLASGQSLSMEGFTDGFYQPIDSTTPMLVPDFEPFWDYFSANPARFVETQNNQLGDYRLKEDVAAAYLSATYETDLFKVVGGLRYEETSTQVHRPQSGLGEVTFVDHEASYGNWLPSVTAYWNLTDPLRVRASYYKAVGRPNPSALALGEVFSVSVDGEMVITRGNPYLLAREADNYSLGLEYYFPDNQGILSVGVYRKEIANEIFTGRTTGLYEGEEVTFNQSMNMADAQVSGVEFNAVRNRLDFLPGRLSNLGVSANLTLQRGESEVLMDDGSTRILKFMREQPRQLFNASVFYREGPLQLRATYAAKSAYLHTINLGQTGTAEDRYETPYEQVDLQARWDVNDRIQFIAEAKNITDEARVNIQNLDDPLVRDHNYTGRSFWLGVSYKL